MSAFDRVALGRMNLIFDAIFRERERQEKLKADGRFEFTCADLGATDQARAIILVEEIGEVCRVILNLEKQTHDEPKKGTLAQLRSELVQVAAVTVAWIEGLDKQSEATEGLQL